MAEVTNEGNRQVSIFRKLHDSWLSLLEASPLNKFFFLVAITILLYGGLIAIDNLFLRSSLTGAFGPIPDLPVYRERTELILNGGMLYRDLPNIESPPLINYILIVPQIMGGAAWVYSGYFSIFSLILATSIYLVMRKWDERLGFLAAILVLISFFGVPESTWGVEDEAIAVFTFLIPVLLLLQGSKKLSSIAIGIGIWSKFLPVFIYPVLLIKHDNWKERKRSLAIVILISLAISLPFLLICPVEYLAFPLYYLLGVKGGSSSGISAWHFLERGGIAIPGTVGFIVTLSAIAISWFYVYKKKLDLWRGAMLVTAAFFAVYPMMHLGYYLIIFAFLVVWAVEDLRIAIRIVAMYLPFALAVGFSDNVTGGPLFNVPWGWLAGLAFSLIGTLLMLDTVRIALKKECFLDREKRSNVELANGWPSGGERGPHLHS